MHEEGHEADEQPAHVVVDRDAEEGAAVRPVPAAEAGHDGVSVEVQRREDERAERGGHQDVPVLERGRQGFAVEDEVRRDPRHVDEAQPAERQAEGDDIHLEAHRRVEVIVPEDDAGVDADLLEDVREEDAGDDHLHGGFPAAVHLPQVEADEQRAEGGADGHRERQDLQYEVCHVSSRSFLSHSLLLRVFADFNVPQEGRGVNRPKE